MAKGYNDIIIKKLLKSFNADKHGKDTNCALVFAYNGTGKTRLSYDFAHYGREEGDPHHTLYYNAFTEDLFTWENDLENDTNRYLQISAKSSLIQGLAGYNLMGDIQKYFSIYTDVVPEFLYAPDNPELPYGVRFSRTVNEVTYENIKISRGEERLFVWCFFRTIIDMVLNGNDAYKDIRYIYIDDPMSSLDDNNVIAFACQLYTMIRNNQQETQKAREEGRTPHKICFVVSSHHSLFFHAMAHGLSNDHKLATYYLSRDKEKDCPVLKDMDNNTPFFYNVAMMSELKRAIDNDNLYTYHFTVLRSVMEKIQEFFGHIRFDKILNGITYRDTEWSGPELEDFYSRAMNVLTHQGSMFQPVEMTPDNKEILISIFNHLCKKYDFMIPDLANYKSERQIYKEKNEAEE